MTFYILVLGEKPEDRLDLYHWHSREGEDGHVPIYDYIKDERIVNKEELTSDIIGGLEYIVSIGGELSYRETDKRFQDRIKSLSNDEQMTLYRVHG